MTIAADLATVITDVANDLPDHHPKRSDLWDGCAAWYDHGIPNSLLGQAVAKFDDLRERFDASWSSNTGLPSEVLPKIGVELSDPFRKWFDALTNAEDSGASWGEAIATAGPVPIEVPAEDGMFPGIPDEVYHADRGSLSSSGARTLLQPGGPAKFRYAPKVFKAEYDFGHVAHLLILGEGSDLVIVQADDWRTKAAREQRDAARAVGKVPVLAKTYAQGEALAQAAKAHDLGEVLFAQGTPELSGYYHDDETGVRLRFRPDWMAGDNPMAVDVKTTTSAAPSDFAKSCGEYGYHIQQAIYQDGLKALGIDAQFLFFAIEKTPPYLCSVVELPDEAVALGRRLARAATDLYAQCTAADEWPGYAPVIHRVDFPEWAYRSSESTLARLERTAS